MTHNDTSSATRQPLRRYVRISPAAEAFHHWWMLQANPSMSVHLLVQNSIARNGFIDEMASHLNGLYTGAVLPAVLPAAPAPVASWQPTAPVAAEQAAVPVAPVLTAAPVLAAPAVTRHVAPDFSEPVARELDIGPDGYSKAAHSAIDDLMNN